MCMEYHFPILSKSAETPYSVTQVPEAITNIQN